MGAASSGSGKRGGVCPHLRLRLRADCAVVSHASELCPRQCQRVADGTIVGRPTTTCYIPFETLGKWCSHSAVDAGWLTSIGSPPVSSLGPRAWIAERWTYAHTGLRCLLVRTSYCNAFFFPNPANGEHVHSFRRGYRSPSFLHVMFCFLAN
jgi:hypothetical protein